MKQSTSHSLESLVVSIENIGADRKDLEFRSKKIIEKLKKGKAELKEEAFSDAFDLDDSE